MKNQFDTDPRNAEEIIRRNVSTIAELEKKADVGRTISDLLAERINRFCGSMVFVWVHLFWFIFWIAMNTFSSHRFDPFPFNFLTLMVSLEAIFLSTFILISENRRSALDDRRNHLDLQINLLSEQENTKMLSLLHEIAVKVGIPFNKSLTALEEETKPETLMQHIDALQKKESDNQRLPTKKTAPRKKQ